MSTTAVATPLRYRGTNNAYVDVATRGTDEHLGLAMEYAIHPSGVGCFIIRFVAHGDGVKTNGFSHLECRERAKFVIPGTATTSAEAINGVRLNKFGLKVFEPAIHREEVDHFAQKFGIWTVLSEWLEEQIQAEGFTVTVDLKEEVRRLVSPVSSADTLASVKSVLEFPDLKKAFKPKPVLKIVEPEEDEESDEDDEDKDEKGWLQ